MPPRIPRFSSSLQAIAPRQISRTLRTPPHNRISQPRQSPKDPSKLPENASNQQSPSPPPPSMSSLLATTSDKDNSLLAPVHMPEDPNAVLKTDHPSRAILEESGIVVQRQIEMMNIFLGFEQANRYVIFDPHGNHIGYLAELDSLGKSIGRQWLNTHRAFTTHVFDKHGTEVLRFHRPFSWINTTIRVYDALEPAGYIQRSASTAVAPVANPADQRLSSLSLDDMRVIGETQSEWAPLRRKYSLFLAHDLTEAPAEPMNTHTAGGVSAAQQQRAPTMTQFAYINEPFLSWDFSLKSADNRLLGSVNRSFRGFAREIFTDTGAYVMRMDSAGLEAEAESRHIVSQSHQGERAYAEPLGGDRTGMTLDQRAVMLATAVTIDFDYFSRHSRTGGGMFPFIWWGSSGEAAGGAAGGAAAGGAAAGGAAEAGAAEGAGAVVGGAGRAVGGAVGGVGAGEGAMAGAGTMAGYEAMQRGLGRDQAPDDASPQNQTPTNQPYEPQGMQDSMHDSDTWGGDNDPWQGGGSSGGDGEGGGGILSWLWDMFFGD